MNNYRSIIRKFS